MIWDRFDDAMDDLDDEESVLRDQIAGLEQQLRDLGEAVPAEPPREPTTFYATDSPADKTHREAWDDASHLRARRNRLVDLVGEARNRRHAE